MFTSGLMEIPKRDSTSARTASHNARMSRPVALPLFTNTNACRSCTAARPSDRPFQPHRSMSYPAGIFTRFASTS